MRLSKRDAQIATEDLRERLLSFPQGAATSELIGMLRFHGHDSLSPRQVGRLLRASGAVDHRYEGSGYMKTSRWKLRSLNSVWPETPVF